MEVEYCFHFWIPSYYGLPLVESGMQGWMVFLDTQIRFVGYFWFDNVCQTLVNVSVGCLSRIHGSCPLLIAWFVLLGLLVPC
jgi:hypothetical protein